MKYEFLEHTADSKFRAYGKTLEEAFENAAYALTSIIVSEDVKPAYKEEIVIDANGNEALLLNFLEELLYLLDTKSFLLSKVEELTIDGNILKSVVFGDTDIEKYELAAHIKAVTYNEMEITEKDGKFTVQVVVDQ